MRYRTMDLFDAIEENSVQLQPHSAANIDRVMELTMKKVNMKNTVQDGHRRSIGVYLLAAVIVTFLMATTVFAYVGFTQYENPIAMLNVFFGNTEYENIKGGQVQGDDFTLIQPTIERVPLDEDVAQNEVGPSINGIGQSISYNGYTLTVTAHLHDPSTNGGTIYYTLENPNGVKGYSLQFDDQVWWPDGEIVQFRYCFDKSYIISSETTDTKLSVASYYSGTSLYEEEYIEVGFYGSDEGIRLDLGYGSNLSSLTSISGEIVLSSVGMEICLQDMEFLGVIDSDGTYVPPVDDNHVDYLAIRFKDGSEYVVKKDMDGILIHNFTDASTRRNPTYVNYTFNRLVDLDEVDHVIINDTVFEFPNTSAPVKDEIAPKVNTELKTGKIEFDQSAESGHIASGNLHHEVLDIRVITKAEEIPEGGRFADYCGFCIYDENGDGVTLHYSDMIQEDGSFIDGVRFILIDVKITSDKAKNWTSKDYHADGGLLGIYENPYEFHIDGEYWLRELNTPDGIQPLDWAPAFYKGTNDTGNPRLYQIQPGETKYFTLGFLVGSNTDGTTRDLSSLCLRVPFGLLEEKDYSENLFALGIE